MREHRLVVISERRENRKKLGHLIKYLVYILAAEQPSFIRNVPLVFVVKGTISIVSHLG